MLPVVVVDVAGDRLNPSHTRELVAKELSVDAVAPDDPRAAEATGRIVVTGSAKDGTLTVRYRKVDEPIERSVKLPDDPSRAESDAAYLAGNLARDEAGELTPQPRAIPAPAAVDAPSSSSDDDRRYAQLRAYVGALSTEARETSVRSGMLLATAGALLLTPGIYVTARGDIESDRGIAVTSFATGGVFIAIGLVAMIAKVDPYEPLTKVLREQEAQGASSEEALANVDNAWKKQVADEQSTRRASAILSFVVAGASLGVGSVLLATGSDVSPGTSAYLIASGGVNAILGIATLLTEGPMERAHRQWHALNGATTSKVSFGLGPLVGGGAASFALTF